MLLVFGGSQGASRLNAVVSESIEAIIADGWEVIHVTGVREGEKWAAVSRSYSFWHVLSYAEDMETLYNHSSVVFARAGATTIAELVAFKKPAFLIPYPFAKDDHQRLNADVFKNLGGGTYCLESQLTSERLLSELNGLPQTVSIEQCNAREEIAKMIRSIL